MKDGPGNSSAGSARRLDCAVKPGPFHRFTISRSGRVSLRRDNATGHRHLSRFEMGTFVHPVRAGFQRRAFDLPAATASGGIFALPTEVTAIIASGPARKALGLMLAALTITLFLLNLRRAGERAGRLAERFSASERTHDIQRQMLDAASRRPPDRDTLAEGPRDGQFLRKGALPAGCRTKRERASNSCRRA